MPKCRVGWRVDPKRLARMLFLLAMTIGMDGGRQKGRRTAGAMARKLPDIHWHSNNSIFDISNTEHVKRVQLLDRVTLLCPQPGLPPGEDGMESEYEYSKLFMVSRDAYQQCALRGGERQLGVCATPERQSSITLVFREFSPLPSAFTFRPGHSYFVITTSNGTFGGLNNTQGGLCSSRNMRLKFDVLASDSDENEGPPSPSTHHHHGRHSHQKANRHPNNPDREQWPKGDEDGPSSSSSSSSLSSSSPSPDLHPPFLYVIHTVDTPHQEEEEERRVAAWGHKNEGHDANSELLASSSHSIQRPSAILFAFLLLFSFIASMTRISR